MMMGAEYWMFGSGIQWETASDQTAQSLILEPRSRKDWQPVPCDASYVEEYRLGHGLVVSSTTAVDDLRVEMYCKMRANTVSIW